MIAAYHLGKNNIIFTANIAASKALFENKLQKTIQKKGKKKSKKKIHFSLLRLLSKSPKGLITSARRNSKSIYSTDCFS